MAWTTPRTWVAGEKPAASTYNTHIRDNFDAIGDPWTSFTTTLGAWTQGNGTLASAYMQAGQLVHFRIKLTVGSTTVAAGSANFTLPVNAVGTRVVAATTLFFDTSAGSYFGGWGFNTTASSLSVRTDASAGLSSTVPFTWATGDELLVTGTYEAA